MQKPCRPPPGVYVATGIAGALQAKWLISRPNTAGAEELAGTVISAMLVFVSQAKLVAQDPLTGVMLQYATVTG